MMDLQKLFKNVLIASSVWICDTVRAAVPQRWVKLRKTDYRIALTMFFLLQIILKINSVRF